MLWLLSEHPLHGYEIKRILSDPGLQFWFPIEFASIYSVLRFLDKQGFAKTVAVERKGRRPERTRYAITAKGRRYFLELLRDAWRQPSRATQPIDLALAAQPELTDEELHTLLGERRGALLERLQQLRQIQRSAPSVDMVERAHVLATTELRWLDEFGKREMINKSGPTDATPEVNVSMASQVQPPIQLIANLVVTTPTDEVLFVRYDPDRERWWLPGADLHPYEHPDEATRRVLAELPGLSVRSARMQEVESFRGRRGWHVVFHYRVQGEGLPQATLPTQWFTLSNLPRTMHGKWEQNVIRRLLHASPSP